MRGSILAGVLVASVGCSRGPALPDQLSDDPSARTTTAVTPPSTPDELAAKCDVPIYPKAAAPDGMSRLPRKVGTGETHYELVLATADSVEKVAAYYSKRLNLAAVREGDSANIVGKTPKGNDAIISIAPEAGRTMIRVKAIAYGR